VTVQDWSGRRWPSCHDAERPTRIAVPWRGGSAVQANLLIGAADHLSRLLAPIFLLTERRLAAPTRSSYAKQSCVRYGLCDQLTRWQRSQIRRDGPP
jgi:hypothetical protein